MCAMPQYKVGQATPTQEKKKVDSVLFIDEPELQNLVLDFPRYVDTISEMIEKSKPRLNVGIFGGWGTGKTTLMWNIEDSLNRHKIKTVRFNAWRYQNEKTHATIPLMLTIISDLAKRDEIQRLWNAPIEEKSRTTTPQNKSETWWQKIKRVVKGLSLDVSFGIPGIAEIGIGYEKPEEDKDEPQKTQAKIEIEKANLQKTTLQEGLDLIEDLLDHANGTENGLKLVVFIDDMDRCTPEKAIEVFESIKIFFDIEGIVFILGLSNEIVELAISKKYEYLKGHFSGEDYLKKIIQLPFTIPQWREQDIATYLDVLLKEYNHSKFKPIFNDNKELILFGVERNPREIKRFLNHFIIAYQIFEQEQGIKQDELMAVQAVRLRWNWFLDSIFETDSEILRTLQKYLKLAEVELKSLLRSKKTDFDEAELKALDPLKKELLVLPEDSIARQVLQNDDLRKFLADKGKIILNIDRDKWKIYRRAEISPELESETIKEKESEFDQRHMDLENELDKAENEIISNSQRMRYVKDVLLNSKLGDPKDRDKIEQELDEMQRRHLQLSSMRDELEKKLLEINSARRSQVKRKGRYVSK